MKNLYVLLCIIYFGIHNTSFAQSQVSVNDDALTVIDSLYKEDQFYFSATYNILSKLPSGVDQTGFSLGLHAGFIKDMPINKRRNIAIGVGLGYSYNSYNQNLGIIEGEDHTVNYVVLDDTYEFDYSKNNFYLHMVELPIEFRWRTSTPTDYRFWRIYTGFKLGYVFSHISNFKGEVAEVRYTDVDGFNDLQYGLTLSVGYNTWNFYVYYALNPIFKDDVTTLISQERIEMNAIKLGLIFYML
ncbi:PorT family protein [Formosa sediminum]|uniref:PorT family protein n=1 Tax=Formosa sediminum TaxID=2594004 RepID=A0A516GNA8_9FLAO|nr:porin family protein [Formosa sediminum]QDO92989.1 PorT family protein [Formosa sediminum]